MIKKAGLAVLSGVLLFLAYPPFELAFLGWIALVPVLLIFKFETNAREAFFYPFLTGIVFFSCLLYWLVNVTVPGMLILIFSLSIFFGLFGLSAKYIFSSSMDFLALPFVWVILEYVRSHLFTGFPWGLLGYTQYTNINLIQIADFTGVYGVSFVLVAFNIALAALFLRSKRRITYTVVALLFIVMSVTYGIYKFQNYYVRGNFKASVVQGNIPQKYKWDEAFADEIIEKYINLTDDAAENDPSLIIWPETSYPYLLEDELEAPVEISEFIKKWKTPLLLGGVFKKGDEYFNSAVLFNENAEIAGIYNKTHLVPFGEYIPFKRTFSFLRDYIDKPIGCFDRGEEYTLFSIRSVTSTLTKERTTRRTNFYKFGVLICFEDVFPYITREFVKRGADFVVNITNDAWFGKTAAARQHLQASVFRAVENRVPVIRAANTGISCFIDSTGEILKRVNVDGEEIFVKAALTDDISMYTGKSYYTVYGDMFVIFCIIALIFIFGVEKFIKKKLNLQKLKA